MQRRNWSGPPLADDFSNAPFDATGIAHTHAWPVQIPVNLSVPFKAGVDAERVRQVSANAGAAGAASAA
ncbi:MAG: hypothetical protein EOO28_15160 [Comamonadaceae bacterium]|nr:MAG: hypothetical protein EOO28_15160 [Comamonadaceae bacterium]